MSQATPSPTPQSWGTSVGFACFIYFTRLPFISAKMIEKHIGNQNIVPSFSLALPGPRQQQADDRAEADKQQMIKKMMTTLKKEKGLVDVAGRSLRRGVAPATCCFSLPQKDPKGPCVQNGESPKAGRIKPWGCAAFFQCVLQTTHRHLPQSARNFLKLHVSVIPITRR